MNHRSIFWKKMMGERIMNSDGFTYSYGRGKGGRKGDSGPSVDRMIRADKRRVRSQERREWLSELGESGDQF